MKILVDADAFPKTLKEIIFKTSNRLKLPLILVSNQIIKETNNKLIKTVLVPSGPDEADNYIVNQMIKGDLIISDDIPLADRVIQKEGFVLNSRGTFMDKNNIGQKIAVRNLLDELRSGGLSTKGPKPFSEKDKHNFANKLDSFLTSILNK